MLEVNDDGVYPAMADALAKQWREGLGLDVKVVRTPWDAYVAKASGATGMDSPFRIRWSTDAIAPTATFNNRGAYLGTLLATGAANNGNWAHWDDKDFNFGLTEEAATLTDVQQRGIVFNRLASRLCAEMPIIPLVFDRPTFLVRDGVVASARPRRRWPRRRALAARAVLAASVVNRHFAGVERRMERLDFA